MKISSKYKVLSIVGLLFLFVYYTLYTIHYTSPPTFAAGEPCILESDVSKAEATGLASSPITGSIKVNVSGQKICVENERAGFVSYKLPTYDDLKSIYFTQSKATKVTNTGTSLTAAADNTVYNYTNTSTDITTNSYNYSGTAVIFIEGSIYINGNITGPADKGLVLVVKNNVNIDRLVRRVDAVIISGGPIYTAGVGCAKSAVSADDLTVNGSLISLSAGSPNRLCRTLADNSSPAEKINWQPKYLVILKDLFADTYQKWSEIQ